MPAHKKSHAKPRKNITSHLQEKAVVYIALAFIIGFCTHLLFAVIFAETKDGQVHACVKKNGEVRIISEYKEYREGKREKERQQNAEDKDGCRQNEQALVWNVQGPPGPSGSGSGGGSSLPLICASCGIGDSIGDRLAGKDLSNAVLYDASLDGANLSGVNFTNANLSQSGLNNANLSNANLENANLLDASTDGTNWDGVKWNNTTCPDGSNSNEHDNTCNGHFSPKGD